MKKFVFSLLAFCLLLSACGQKVPVVRSPRHEQAIELNQRAQRAFVRGEYLAAEGLYSSSLQLDVATENVEGIAINMLNLSKVNMALDRPQIAQQYLDRILQDKALQYSATHLAAASLQYSLLRLRMGDVLSATAWADKAAENCISDCKLSGVIANLRANIAIQSNDVAQALKWSEHAVSINKNESQIEHANALRLQGHARFLNREFEAALPLLEAALSIDKSLGLPEKIRYDLNLLAEVCEKLNKAELSKQYRARASRIAATSLK